MRYPPVSSFSGTGRSLVDHLYLKVQYCALICFSLSQTGAGVTVGGIGELGLGVSLTGGYASADPCSDGAPSRRIGLAVGGPTIGEGSVGIRTDSGVEFVDDYTFGVGAAVGLQLAGGPSRSGIVSGCGGWGDSWLVER